VGGEVLGAKILSRVNPVYPPLAKQARIQGLVKLEGVIAKDGTIEQLRLLSGHPLLAPAALAAVKQWRYRPTLLNGEPVEVVAPIEVHFILSH
jgi:protein TonB